jgi:hypothetical protein
VCKEGEEDEDIDLAGDEVAADLFYVSESVAGVFKA